MEINSVNENQFIDLFGSNTVAPPKEKTGFVAGTEGAGVDLFNLKSTTDTTTVVSASTEETTTVASTTTQSASTEETTTTTVDLFAAAAEQEKKPGRKPKYDFSDMSGYYEDRVKAGKFVKIEEETEEGPKMFVPKTPEDFDEVIEIQVDHRIKQEKAKIAQQVYQSKSPAWQAVLKYSELVDDPAEVVPFIEGVRTMESVAQVDENTPEGAEKVVRTRLLQKGDTPELIDQQIETLRAAEKLVSTAKVYKPLIIQQEQAQLGQMIQERKAQEAEYLQMVEKVEKDAIKAIETPLLGKHKLSKDEKALVYEMIAYPSEEIKGYQIFQAVDDLYTKGDFETLKMIALLAGGKKDALLNYISAGVANQTAADLQRKLRVASSSASSTGDDSGEIEERSITVTRPKYSGKFGR